MDNIIQIFTQYSANSAVMVPTLLILSFLAGIISSLSPCSLGILPLIIGYVGGYSKEGNKKLFIQMISFSIGLAFVLSIIGVICALTGKAFTGFATPVIWLLFASVIVILGLNLLGILEIQFPAVIKKMPQNKNGSLIVFPFIIGVFFALAASPCSSPILASIMALAAFSTNILFSILLLFCFALGQCIIIIFFALFTSTLKHSGVLAKYSSILMKLSGLILLLAGLFIYYLVFTNI
ncbi:MAG: cytochrome c biogenesis CcdA family protein [Candidatus Gastranaerophilales bacterium]|nr:cytochrome c biogenesis CcdA family protein [Candidatus Gastranaerophilales bacterium]